MTRRERLAYVERQWGELSKWAIAIDPLGEWVRSRLITSRQLMVLKRLEAKFAKQYFKIKPWVG